VPDDNPLYGVSPPGQVVDTGFDPLFGDPLRRFIAAANAQGIGTRLLSGARTDEDQRQLVANAAATRAGTPLPYPKRGAVPRAAPVGSSAHEYGLAADVQATDPANQARLKALASQFGLTSNIPNDPNHFQLADWGQTAAGQTPGMSWDQAKLMQPSNVPSAYAQNMDVSAAPAAQAIAAASPAGTLRVPGKTLYSLPDMVGMAQNAGFQGQDAAHMAAIAMAESGGNPGAHGKAGEVGLTQINPHAWDFASMAANPQGAFNAARQVYDKQGWGAWSTDPSSSNFTPKNSMAQFLPQAQAALTPTPANVGPGPGNVGPVTGFLPGTPTGQGAIGADVNATVPPPPQTPAVPAAAVASPAMTALSKAADAANQETANMGQTSQNAAAQSQQQLSQMMAQSAAMGQARQQAQAQAAGQLMATVMQRGAMPLQTRLNAGPPGGGPPVGAGPPPGAGPQLSIQDLAAQAMAGAPGLTLNSTGGLYG
jgi:hypothetical protein